jgi:serine/threonine protein phosphatase PrpC
MLRQKFAIIKMENFNMFEQLLKCAKVELQDSDVIFAINNENLQEFLKLFSITFDDFCNFPNLEKIISNHIIQYVGENTVTMISRETFDYVENQSVDGIQFHEKYKVEPYEFVDFDGILLSQNDYDSLKKYSDKSFGRASKYECTKKYDGRSGEDRIAKKSFRVNGDLIVLMAVFDGHGGKGANSQIANYLLENVERFEILAKPFPENAETLREKATELFVTLDREMEEKKLQNGSTATICLHNESNGNTFFIHVGDSRAICRDDSGKLYETKDHKPGNPEEIARIEKAGGFVLMGKVPRVGASLAVSRSFGDFRLKKTQTESIDDWISVIPDITSNNGKPLKISKKGSFILLASDGLWDGFTSKEVEKLIDVRFHHNFVCEGLVKHGKKKSNDDIAVILQYYY